MVHDHAAYLAGRGHTVHILASKPGPPATECDGLITVFRMRQIDHPMLRFYTSRIDRYYHIFDAHSLMVLPLLLRERYDLVHLFVYHHGPTLRLVRKLRGTPWLFHVVFLPPYVSRRGDRRLLQVCLDDGAPVRVFSQFCAQYMRRNFGVDSVVIPPTVDTALFRPLLEKDRSQPRILFTADLSEPRKGAHLLARAFNAIHRAHPQAILQLAGPVGFNPAGIKQLLELVEPPARERVEMLEAGSLTSLPRLYSTAAVTVLPSLDEAFGMVLSESLACGTPVVGTRSGTLPELISDPAVGTLFDRVDDAGASAANLAAAVADALTLADDPETPGRCQAHAQRWTWEAVGPRLDAYQQSAVPGRTSGIRPGR